MKKNEVIKVDETDWPDEQEIPFTPRKIEIDAKRKPTDDYTIQEELGRGKFGVVCKCKEKKTNRLFAAKHVETNRPGDRKDVLNEVEIMKILQHPRLLQLYDVFDNGKKMVLILELITGGELFERVIDDNFILTEKACCVFMRQICEGIDFMHTSNILHLDMKPENILCVTRRGNRIKLIDFGLARKYDPNESVKALFGTPEFVAPEVVNYDKIGYKTDMWSLGVICYILLSGFSPFMGESDGETLSNVTAAEWDFDAEEFDEISDDAKDFIEKLLQPKQKERMSAGEALHHPWLQRDNTKHTKELSKRKLKRFVIRRKWQKATNAILAIKRMGGNLNFGLPKH